MVCSRRHALVLSFLVLASALAAQAPRKPRGIYSKVDISDYISQLEQANPSITPAQLESAFNSFYQDMLGNPAISGLTLQIHWDVVNPNPPTGANPYFWTYIDDAFAQVAMWNVQNPTQAAKTIQFIVTPGFNSPQWVLNELTSCDGLFQTPAQTPPSTCGKATFLGYQETADGSVLPLPWNPTYKSAWRTFLTALSARYLSNPAFVSISVAGPTAASSEMIMPNDANTTNPQTQFGTPIAPNTMWRLLLALQYPGMAAYQNTDQGIIDEWNAAIDMYGQVFSGVTLVATTGGGLPNLSQNFTIPPAFVMDCSNPNMDCAAETTILSHFVDPTVGGPNAKATQTSGMTARSNTFNNTGVAGVKFLSQLTASSTQVLGGEQFDFSFALKTLQEGCTSPFPPDATDTPAGCTVPPACNSQGCIPVACTPQACLAPGVTQASLAGFTVLSQVPNKDLLSPEQSLYNVLNIFFNGTPAAAFFGAPAGVAPLNFLQAYDQDITYAEAHVNSPAQIVQTNGVTVSMTAQALLNLASQKLLEIAEGGLQPFAFEGQSVSASGTFGTINLTFPVGFAWTAGSSATWLVLTSATSGTGSATLSYQVVSNAGADRTATITVAGYSFTIEQEAASISGLAFVGSMPHLAAEENWITSFTLVNKSGASATARLSLFGDPAGPLALPLAFPQILPALLPEWAASLDRTLSPNASLIVNSAGPQTPPVQVGSAQLAATGAVDGFAIFHLIPGAQEAVVPLETRNASSYLLAFDNTGGVVLGVALANVSAQAGNIGVVIRDDSGAQIGTGALAMAGNGHTSFVVSTQYPVTGGKRGTIEFDTPVGGQISVLGIRTTPLGGSNTLTTIPALANIGTGGGSIAHIAAANGWQTTFVLVNTGTSVGHAHLAFLDDSGSPLPLSLSFPQTGVNSTASSVDQSLTAGGTLLVQASGPVANPVVTGSAQLTAGGNVGGFVIFRYNPNGQEAVVPMETRNAAAYLLAFDNTTGTATGVALNAVSTQAVNIPVIVRDDTGAQIATDTLNLASNGHLAFTLGTDKYPAAANIRGTIEFDAPAGAQIGALGIRIPIAHTFTTLPALAK